MDSRKRKLKATLPILHFLSRNFMLLCLCLFVVFALLHHGFSSGPFHPRPIVPTLAVLSSSVSNSVQESTPYHTTDNSRVVSEKAIDFKVEHRVVFTDHILVILLTEPNSPSLQKRIDCVYSKELNGDFTYHPMMSADEYGDDRWIVQCPSPPVNYTSVVGLRGYSDDVSGFDWEAGLRQSNETTQFSDYLAYEAFLDGEDTAVVLVKGLRLKSDRQSDATCFRCHFKKWGSLEDGVGFTTVAITAAQEVIRCPLPPPVKERLRNNEDFEITVERIRLNEIFPSIARLHKKNDEKYVKSDKEYKYELCGCSMVWNQASVIKEWIAYHGWLGVERWFVYDNNSDDDLNGVIDELDGQNYNVTRHAWPWVKSQEAGFSHCVVRARDECRWVGFFDVDEFYFFPQKNNTKLIEKRRPDALRAVVDDVTLNNPLVGEIRTDCHNFGPSRLKKIPEKGVTLGYTCRMRNSERHKSIIRPIAVDDTLLNQIHHFKLKKEFESMTLSKGKTVINHYKYQVWNVFKAKFHRRVSTFVTDWQEKQNEKSKDRAPGLGTEAIEPSDWHTRFCEVWDSKLKDFILKNLANPDSGLVSWDSVL